MKKLVLSSLLVLAMGSVAQAQVFDPNILFVAGVDVFKDSPSAGNRAQFLFSANVPGVRLVTLFSQPLYVGGVGFDLRTVDVALGEVTGFGLTVPALTYNIKGGPIAIQVGFVKDLTGTNKTTGFYAAVGTGVMSPKAIAAKRAKKKAEVTRIEAERLAALHRSAIGS